MGTGGAWELLQKLGYKHAGAYKVPHSQGGKAVMFDRAEDLCRHLARFGLAGDDPTALSPEEQLKLELYIAGCSKIDTL